MNPKTADLVSPRDANPDGSTNRSVLHRIDKKLIEDKSQWHRYVVGKLAGCIFDNNTYPRAKSALDRAANRLEKISRAEARRLHLAVENLLRRSHRRDS